MKAIEALLSATQDDVELALADASFGNWPQDEADLLEFFILMIDTKLGEAVLTSSDTCMDDLEENFRLSHH